MSAMEEGFEVMSHKQIRKWEKKQKRSSRILFRDTGIKTCEVSRFIMLCNVGLVSGLEREEVTKLFLPFGDLEKVIMLPGKSYCFVAFYDEKDALKAYVALNGKHKLNALDTVLFLAYTENVPSDEINPQTPHCWPSGLIYLQDFVTEEEEQILLNCVRWATGGENSGKSLKHRRVKHYGFEFRYDNNNVDKDDPLPEDLPEECSFVEERLLQKTGIHFRPNQLTVNEYQPGQGIPPHIDTHSAFEDVIVSLSLGSFVIMEFKHSDGRHAFVPLPRRSLILMTGESRYSWTHGITPRKMDVVTVNEENDSKKVCLSVRSRDTRTSFTFRRILDGECTCNYPQYCDSNRNRERKSLNCLSDVGPLKIDNSLNNELAAKLEILHVHNVYEEIASHFSDTRHKAWPNISQFVNSLPYGSVLLDIGCGNGKYFGFNKNIYEIGCDQSSNLASVTKERGFQVFTCNCLHIPLKPESADACICIAVIHHLSTKERRLQSLMQIAEVLRTGGQALVYVWAKEQERKEVKSSYLRQMGKKKSDNKEEKKENDILSPDHLISGLDISLPVHRNRTDFQHDDLLVPWKLNAKCIPGNEKLEKEPPMFFRYYHVFVEGELESLCKEIPIIKVVNSYYDQGNWCVLLEKLE